MKHPVSELSSPLYFPSAEIGGSDSVSRLRCLQKLLLGRSALEQAFGLHQGPACRISSLLQLTRLVLNLGMLSAQLVELLGQIVPLVRQIVDREKRSDWGWSRSVRSGGSRSLGIFAHGINGGLSS